MKKKTFSKKLPSILNSAGDVNTSFVEYFVFRFESVTKFFYTSFNHPTASWLEPRLKRWINLNTLNLYKSNYSISLHTEAIKIT